MSTKKGKKPQPKAKAEVTAKQPTLTVKQRIFLAGYAQRGTLLGAEKATRIMRENHTRWIQQPRYQEAFRAAEQAYVDLCETELHRRAYIGLNKPVIYQGSLQYEPARDKAGNVRRDKKGIPVLSDRPLTIKEYSDVLLMFHLKSKRPDRYRDNSSVQVSGPAGAPLSIDVRFVNAPDAGVNLDD